MYQHIIYLVYWVLEAFFCDMFLKSKVKSERNCNAFNSNYWGNIRRNRYIPFTLSILHFNLSITPFNLFKVYFRQFEVDNRGFEVYNRQFKVSKLIMKNKKKLCGTNTLPYLHPAYNLIYSPFISYTTQFSQIFSFITELRKKNIR